MLTRWSMLEGALGQAISTVSLLSFSTLHKGMLARLGAMNTGAKGRIIHRLARNSMVT